MKNPQIIKLFVLEQDEISFLSREKFQDINRFLLEEMTKKSHFFSDYFDEQKYYWSKNVH